jgi:hypothetical protein
MNPNNPTPETIPLSDFPVVTHDGKQYKVLIVPEDGKPNDYAVLAPNGDGPIFICGGVDARSKEAKLQFPNCIGQHEKIAEFKHSRKNGSKFWTSKPGVEIWFAIPRSEIKVIKTRGYSYVPVIINGVETFLNVSGSGGGGQPFHWIDWISPNGQTVRWGMGKRNIMAIAEVAVSGVPLPFEREVMDAREQKRFNEMVACDEYKPTFIKAYRAGTPLKVCLQEGISFAGEEVPEMALDSITFGKGKYKKLPQTPEDKADGRQRLEWAETSFRIVSIIGKANSRYYRVKPKDVDWLKTEQANEFQLMGAT